MEKTNNVRLALREHLKLLHLPTTSCILAFAIIGSTSAPVIYLDRLLLLIIQLFFVGGIASNYFDEIKGRPWHTKIQGTHLWIIGFSALFISNIIGIFLTITIAWWFGVFVTLWNFFTLTYNLELFNGFFHNTPSLSLSWGTVFLGSYYLQNPIISSQILILSIITGYIAGYGRNLYETAKPYCKDKDSSQRKAKNSWILLKILILFVDLLAMTRLAYVLLV